MRKTRASVVIAAAVMLSITACTPSRPTQCGNDVCRRADAICSNGKNPRLDLVISARNYKNDATTIGYRYTVTNESGRIVVQDGGRVIGDEIDEVGPLSFGDAKKVTVTVVDTATKDRLESRFTSTCEAW